MSVQISKADAADLSALMATINLTSALKGTEPYFHELDVKISDLKIPQDEKTQSEIIEKAYATYRSSSTVRGTIDIAYKQYGQILFKKLISGETRIPNGCCTMKNCYINKFFDIIVGMLAL